MGAAVGALPPGTPLAQRVAALSQLAQHYAKRCVADCSGRGVCDWQGSYPPSCACVSGASGDMCADVACPGPACSGHGACDSTASCAYDADTGERTCVGGSGKCACVAPWTSAGCNTRACPSALLVLDRTWPANLSQAAIEAYYTSRGWAVERAWQAGYDGVPWAPGAVPGDRYSRAAVDGSTAVAVVRFIRAEEAEEARLELEARAPSVPSRGDPLLAPLFLTQYRAAVERQRTILNLFRLPNAPCSSAGACDGATGVCSCTGNAAGAACEMRSCPRGCSGHGACNTATGVCECHVMYQWDEEAGCALVPLGLASSTCEEEARDGRLNASSGERRAPIQLSCLLGVPSGQVTAASARFTVAAPGSHLCADCSGYSPLNVSMLHIATEAPLLASPAVAVAGVGALPPSRVTFQLQQLRLLGLAFSAFAARPGVVRRWAACGSCAGSRCGASFAVLLDGAQVWAANVSAGAQLRLDVRAASTLTLVTESHLPTYWEPSQDSYSGGPAPGVATLPQRAPFCDGAAWAGASLV